MRFILAHDEARRRAVKAVQDAQPGQWVTIDDPVKSREQEDRYHAMVGDIARQYQFMGRRWSKDDMKRLLVDAFARAMQEAGTPLRQKGEIIPSLDGRGFVQLGIQTRRFLKPEASAFIEYCS